MKCNRYEKLSSHTIFSLSEKHDKDIILKRITNRKNLTTLSCRARGGKANTTLQNKMGIVKMLENKLI